MLGEEEEGGDQKEEKEEEDGRGEGMEHAATQ